MSEPDAPQRLAKLLERARTAMQWFDSRGQDTKIMLGFAGSILGLALIIVTYLIISAYFVHILVTSGVLVLFGVAAITAVQIMNRPRDASPDKSVVSSVDSAPPVLVASTEEAETTKAGGWQRDPTPPIQSGFAGKNLMSGETIVYRTHLHWKIYLDPIGLLVAAMAYWFALTIVQWALGRSAEWLMSRWVMMPAFVLFLLAGALTFVRWVLRRSSEYVVTSHRVLIKTGIFRRDSMEMLLEKIENMSVQQGFIERVINAGEIVFTGTGGSTEVFDDIQSPLELRRQVQEAIAHRLERR
mgnify:CR=1 FL=1